MSDHDTVAAWAKVEELFGTALELQDPERSDFVRRETQGQPALRSELLELLAAEGESVDYFDDLSNQLAGKSLIELEAAAAPRVRIGAYRTRELIGRGGMGVVYRAERVDGAFEQDAALKLLHLDLTAPDMQARFVAERQLLARLDHPHIARLLDGGLTDEGRPYLVMEYVDGLPLDDYCRGANTDLEQTLRLFLQVIDAVAYLHRNLVVHRDLKPSNVLVTATGEAKLLDFGIAKMLGDADAPSAERTVTGAQMLTPAYAAPEQIANGPVTTATDVYGLGAVLYRLLTDTSPHEHTSASGPRTAALPLAEPPAPSAVVRRGEPGQPRPWSKIDHDLDAICLQALREEPEQRYASAEQFGEDLRRYLGGYAVVARGRSKAYLLARFLRRNWRSAVAAAALIGVLAVGVARERSLRQAANSEALKANAVSDFLANLLSSAAPEVTQGRDLTVKEVLTSASTQLEGEHALSRRPEVEARVRLALGDTLAALSAYPDAIGHLRKALALSGGLEDPSALTLDIAESLAVALRSADELVEAETLMRAVVAERARVLSPTDPAMLESVNNLASVLWGQERYLEVEVLDRQTLEHRRREFGDQHPDTLRSMNSLGGTLYNLGRHSEAANLYAEALKTRRKIDGADHPATLRLINNLAACYVELGRTDEAEPLLTEVLANRRRVLGTQHRETATSMQNLGAVLLARGKTASARTVLNEAMVVRAEVFDDPDAAGVLSARSLYAMALAEEGSVDQAVGILTATHKTQVANDGARGRDAERTGLALASVLISRSDAARNDLVRATELLLQLEPEPDLETATPAGLLAWAQLELARNDAGRALAFAQRVAALGADRWAPHHPILLDALSVAAQAHHILEQPEQAAQAARHLVSGREQLLGRDHPKSVASRQLLTLVGGD